MKGMGESEHLPRLGPGLVVHHQGLEPRTHHLKGDCFTIKLMVHVWGSLAQTPQYLI